MRGNAETSPFLSFLLLLIRRNHRFFLYMVDCSYG
ncbi:hypothetical protein EVA_03698 [gut metagenome]|uniref:Uncharacterized protein n=1 Tax=gut metagenome TaxID=749906 RepID=J9D647_9ZZZZ